MQRFLGLKCLRVGVLAVFALGTRAAFAGEEEIAAPHVVIKEPGRHIDHMVFSPDGTRLALSEGSSTLANKNMEAMYDSVSAKKVWSRSLFFGTYHLRPVFSPDGRLLAMDEDWKSQSTAPEGIHLLDAETGKPTVVLKCGPRITGMGVAFSPDGKLLTVYGQESMTWVPQLWDVSTGKLAGSMQLPRSADVPPGLPDPRITVQPANTYSAFSPDGRLVAWSCLMLNHQIWEVESGKLRGLLDWPDDKNAANGNVVRSNGNSEGAPFPIPLFSPTGKRLVSALPDQRILIVDTETGKTIRIVEKVPNAFLSFQKDGKTVACCSNVGPHLKLVHLNLETGQMETVIDREVPSKLPVVHAAFTADGSKLATIERRLGPDFTNPLALPGKCVVRLWDVQYGKPLGEVELANASAKKRSKKATRTTQPAVPNQGPVPVDDGTYVACYDSYSNAACLFTPDGKRLAVTGATGYDTVDIWEVAWILLPADKRPAATTEKSIDAPTKREPKHVFRRWTSADAKFSVEAEFQEVKDGKVSLKKRDGEVIRVAIEKLCPEDRDYVEALE